MASILFEIEKTVAKITLNRPEKFNAFNREMAFLLLEKLDQCETNLSVRAVLITGTGKAFCSGQDLSEVVDPKSPGLEKIVSEQYNPIVQKIRNLSKPVIAAVNGIAAGAGANIALCCDIVIASENAAFVQAFSRIGLIPDSGGTYFLPRLVGLQRATAMMMLAEKITAAEAEKYGMIYRHFPDEAFEEAVNKITGQLAIMPTKALAYTKQALNLSMEQSLEEQLKTEDMLQQKAAATNDFKEGVAAFLEKRIPDFKGD